MSLHSDPLRPRTRDSLETLTEAVARLVRAGFRESFRAQDGGLVAAGIKVVRAPEELCVSEIVRFEGESDPGDEAVLVALSSCDGEALGTLVAGYGTSADPATAAVLKRLEASHAAGVRARERASARSGSEGEAGRSSERSK